MIGTRSSRRLITMAGALALAFVLPLATQAATPTWGPIHHVVDAGRPAAGAAIATTHTVDHRYLHATWRRGAGTVEFARSSNGGASWSTPVVLNGSSEIFGEPRVAATGHDVWVAYAKTFEDPDTGTMGRAIVVRHNGANGASGAWDKAIRLTARSGDVRSPTIAVSGSSIYVAFSDLRTDSTRVAASHDRGKIWISMTVGQGFAEDGEGVPTTLPVIATARDNVVVAWLAANNLAKARVSTDGADHWSTPVALGEGLASAAARAGRLAILGAAPGGDEWLRIWHAGTWGPIRDVPEISLGGEVAAAVAGDIVLREDHRVGVVYSAQVEVDEETADTWEEITWLGSPDEGATWFDAVRVSRAGSPTEAFVATSPTAVWLRGRLWIAWDQEKVADPGQRFFALRERS